MSFTGKKQKTSLYYIFNVNSMKTNDVNKKVDRTTIITILTIYYALYQYPLSIILAKVGVTACRAVIILDKNINNFGQF